MWQILFMLNPSAFNSAVQYIRDHGGSIIYDKDRLAESGSAPIMCIPDIRSIPSLKSDKDERALNFVMYLSLEMMDAFMKPVTAENAIEMFKRIFTARFVTEDVIARINQICAKKDLNTLIDDKVADLIKSKIIPAKIDIPSGELDKYYNELTLVNLTRMEELGELARNVSATMAAAVKVYRPELGDPEMDAFTEGDVMHMLETGEGLIHDHSTGLEIGFPIGGVKKVVLKLLKKLLKKVLVPFLEKVLGNALLAAIKKNPGLGKRISEALAIAKSGKDASYKKDKSSSDDDSDGE
jgi:hypothetical protein